MYPLWGYKAVDPFNHGRKGGPLATSLKDCMKQGRQDFSLQGHLLPMAATALDLVDVRQASSQQQFQGRMHEQHDLA